MLPKLIFCGPPRGWWTSATLAPRAGAAPTLQPAYIAPPGGGSASFMSAVSVAVLL